MFKKGICLILSVFIGIPSLFAAPNTINAESSTEQVTKITHKKTKKKHAHPEKIHKKIKAKKHIKQKKPKEKSKLKTIEIHPKPTHTSVKEPIVKYHYKRGHSHYYQNPPTPAPQLLEDEDSPDILSTLQPNNNEDLIEGNFNASFHERLDTERASACQTAKKQIGKRYIWGAENPHKGFDCSGLSQYVYSQEGIVIPRTALEQYHSLSPVKHLQEGDLVFFHTHPNSREVSHVGIYIGDGYFVDSPRTGEAVRVDRLDNAYWKKNYAGARRVLTPKKVEKQQSLPSSSQKITPPPKQSSS